MFELDEHAPRTSIQEWIVGALKSEVGITNPDEAMATVHRDTIDCTGLKIRFK